MPSYQVRFASDFVTSAQIDLPSTIDKNRVGQALFPAITEQSTGTTLYLPLQYFASVNQVVILQFPKATMRKFLDNVPEDELYLCLDDTMAPKTATLVIEPGAATGACIPWKVLDALVRA